MPICQTPISYKKKTKLNPAELRRATNHFFMANRLIWQTGLCMAQRHIVLSCCPSLETEGSRPQSGTNLEIFCNFSFDLKFH